MLRINPIINFDFGLDNLFTKPKVNSNISIVNEFTPESSLDNFSLSISHQVETSTHIPMDQEQSEGLLTGAALGMAVGSIYTASKGSSIGVIVASSVMMGAVGATAGYTGISLKQLFEDISEHINNL